MEFHILSVIHFPEVTIQYFPKTLLETRRWHTEMDHILDRRSDFILIHPPNDPLYYQNADEKEIQQSRKETILWHKKNKDRFEKQCKAILLQPQKDAEDLEFLHQHRSAVEKVYRVPTHILHPITIKDQLIKRSLSPS